MEAKHINHQDSRLRSHESGRWLGPPTAPTTRAHHRTHTSIGSQPQFHSGPGRRCTQGRRGSLGQPQGPTGRTRQQPPRSQNWSDDVVWLMATTLRGSHLAGTAWMGGAACSSFKTTGVDVLEAHAHADRAGGDKQRAVRFQNEVGVVQKLLARAVFCWVCVCENRLSPCIQEKQPRQGKAKPRAQGATQPR